MVTFRFNEANCQGHLSDIWHHICQAPDGHPPDVQIGPPYTIVSRAVLPRVASTVTPTQVNNQEEITMLRKISHIAACCTVAVALSGCDSGTYTPSRHAGADIPTGSLLSGGDTGISDNGSIANNPSIRSNYSGPIQSGNPGK